jgi:hypothetical protein
MSSHSSSNDKNLQDPTLGKTPTRYAHPQDDFNQVHYNKMVDESK